MLMLSDQVVVAIAASGFGLVIGSAINAYVWRLKVGRSWVHGRSECPDCGHQLAAKDLVPVVSWLMLGGKCRYCRKPIQDHPIVEVMTALLFGLSAYVLNPQGLTGWVELSWWLVMLVLLIVLAAYDARWMILPDKVMIPLAVVAAAHVLYLVWLTSSWHVAVMSVLAAVLAGGGFLLLAMVSKGKAMGGGDIKLAAVMGLILGLMSSAFAMMVSFDVAALVGLALIIAHRRRRRDLIPFGPFLVLGTVVAYLWGHDIMQWYLRANGLT